MDEIFAFYGLVEFWSQFHEEIEAMIDEFCVWKYWFGEIKKLYQDLEVKVEFPGNVHFQTCCWRWSIFVKNSLSKIF